MAAGAETRRILDASGAAGGGRSLRCTIVLLFVRFMLCGQNRGFNVSRGISLTGREEDRSVCCAGDARKTPSASVHVGRGRTPRTGGGI